MYSKSLNYLVLLLVALTPAGVFGQEEKTTAVFALKHIDCASATQLVGEVLDAEDVRIGSDERTNSMFIYGDEKSQQRISSLLKLLDVPVDASEAKQSTKQYGNVSVQVLWVVDVPQNREEDFEGLKDPPESIQKLLSGALKDRLVITNPKLGTQLYLKCQPDNVGSGEMAGEGNGELGHAHEFAISCNSYLRVQEDDKYSVELDIVAKIDDKESVVSTNIVTVNEHPVCLAIAPIAGIDSLFIVRVFND